MNRVAFDIIVCISLWLCPWWVVSVVAFIGLISYKDFYEFLFVGSIIFALYNIPTRGIMTSPLWYSLTLSVIYLGIQLSRRYITYYKT